MRILVINGGRNINVSNSIERLRAHLGDDRVDVIEYGWERARGTSGRPNTSMHQNDVELEEILSTTPIMGDYDLLLISGGHGDARLTSKEPFERRELNSLSNRGVGTLTRYFQRNDIKFGHILLGVCFSINYQEDFIPFLKDKTGTIFSFLAMSMDNCCGYVEDLSEGKAPNMTGITTRGLKTIMAELVFNHNLGEKLSSSENKLVMAYTPIHDLSENTDRLSRLMDSMTLHEPHNIGYLIERLSNNRSFLLMHIHDDDKKAMFSERFDELLKILNNSLSTLYSIHAGDADKIEEMLKNKSTLPEGIYTRIQKDINDYHTSDHLKVVFSILQMVYTSQIAEENALLYDFMKKNYHLFTNKDLLPAIECPFGIYQNGTLYVRDRAPKTLPKDVLNSSDPSEIPEQLKLISLEIQDVGRRTSITTIPTFEFPTFYAEATASRFAAAAGTEIDDELFAVPQPEDAKLAVGQTMPIDVELVGAAAKTIPTPAESEKTTTDDTEITPIPSTAVPSKH